MTNPQAARGRTLRQAAHGRTLRQASRGRTLPLAPLVLASLVLLIAAPGCTRMPNNMGYVVDEELVSEVQPGVDNRESVARALGRPTMVTQWDDNVWYYVARLTGQRAFLRPIPTAQTVLIVTFDDKGVVSAVERRGLEKVADINPNSDKTATLGRDRSLFDDIFGNIGSFGGVGQGGGPPGP
jgi:outer membrane protein assembly factor BamE (lipoprotein component of BamABCDE complex)